MKKILAISCLSSFAMTAVPMAAYAEATINPISGSVENSVMPRMQYIAAWDNTFSLSNQVAEVSCWVEGDYLSATKAKVIVELQVKSGSNWLPVAIWTDTQDSYRAEVNETKSVTKGQVYRAKATYMVWEGSKSESHVVYSGEKTA